MKELRFILGVLLMLSIIGVIGTHLILDPVIDKCIPDIGYFSIESPKA